MCVKYARIAANMNFPANDHEFDNAATFVAFPGWATDCRVFAGHRLPGQVICLPEDKRRAGGIACLDRPVWLFGWSLGAYAALDVWANASPNVLGIILAGVRPVYPPSAIDLMRARLHADPQGCLESFYSQCFHGAPREWMQTQGNHLIHEYLCSWNIDLLLKGLEALAARSLPIDSTRGENLLILHGGRDRVAPVDETSGMAMTNGEADIRVVPSAGHAMFLDPGCTEVVAEWIRSRS